MRYYDHGHEEADDFTYEENQAYADLICEGFVQDEIEALEDATAYYYSLIEDEGEALIFQQGCPLILEQVWAFEGEDE